MKRKRESRRNEDGKGSYVEVKNENESCADGIFRATVPSILGKHRVWHPDGNITAGQSTVRSNSKVFSIKTQPSIRDSCTADVWPTFLLCSRKPFERIRGGGGLA